MKISSTLDSFKHSMKKNVKEWMTYVLSYNLYTKCYFVGHPHLGNSIISHDALNVEKHIKGINCNTCRYMYMYLHVCFQLIRYNSLITKTNYMAFGQGTCSTAYVL